VLCTLSDTDKKKDRQGEISMNKYTLETRRLKRNMYRVDRSKERREVALMDR
jgi:hypothetical protein